MNLHSKHINHNHKSHNAEQDTAKRSVVLCDTRCNRNSCLCRGDRRGLSYFREGDARGNGWELRFGWLLGA